MNETALQHKLTEYRRRIPNVDDLPTYKILQRLIQAAITQGDWKPGEAIPPERLFAKLTGTSVGTVKKAIGNLVNDGILYRRQGSGTYVASKSLMRNMRKYYLFLNDFNDAECVNAITLHSVAMVRPVPELNKALKLPDDEQLIQLTRIFKEDEEVGVLTRSYFSARAFSGLLQVSAQRIEKVPLYVIIEEDYNMRLSHTDELVALRAPRAQDAELLDMSKGKPTVYIKSLTYSTQSDTPFEYRESFCKIGKKYIYRCIDYS